MAVQHNNIPLVGNHGEVSRLNYQNIEGSLPMQSTMKLFSAHSIINSFENHRNVVLHWFKCGTKFDGVDYKNLIDGFWQLGNRERYLCMLHVNEYFTESECTLLQKYLKLEYDTELFMDEQVLPMKLLKEGNGDIFSYSAISCANSTYDLTRNEPGDLPFEVKGYYDMERCFPSQELYKPYSEISLFGNNLLRISWYKVWENFDEIDNSTLIFGYDKSKDQENQNAGVWIDEYFDWDDISLLKSFVDYAYHYGFLFDKVPIPIEPKESSNLISKLKCISNNKCIIDLDINFECDDFSELPFEIHGYCDVREDRDFLTFMNTNA